MPSRQAGGVAVIGTNKRRTGAPNKTYAARACFASFSGVELSVKIVNTTSPLAGNVPTPCKVGKSLFSAAMWPSIALRSSACVSIGSLLFPSSVARAGTTSAQASNIPII